MALEEPIKQQQHHHHQVQQQNQQQYCDQCHNPISKEWVHTHINKQTNKISLLCSLKCKTKFTKVTGICIYCGSAYKKSRNTQKYCSTKCYKESREIECLVCHKRIKGRKIKGVQTKKYCSRTCSSYNAKGKPKIGKYSKHGYCEVCLKWIPKQDSILKPKGTQILIGWRHYTLKKDNFYCNICKSRLVIKKRKTKTRDVKRIE